MHPATTGKSRWRRRNGSARRRGRARSNAAGLTGGPARAARAGVRGPAGRRRRSLAMRILLGPAGRGFGQPIDQVIHLDDIAFDVEIVKQIAFGHAQLSAGQQHRAQGAGMVQHDGHRPLSLVWPARPVPQAHPDRIAGQATKQIVQQMERQIRRFVGLFRSSS